MAHTESCGTDADLRIPSHPCDGITYLINRSVCGEEGAVDSYYSIQFSNKLTSQRYKYW